METEDGSRLSLEASGVAQPPTRVVDEAKRYLDRVASGQVFRLSFGMGDSVDRETSGIESENLIVLAGETKGGKTLSAVNIVADNLRMGVRTLVITTEVSATSYMLRVVSRQTKIPLSRMREPLTDAERESIDSALAMNRRLPLYITDKPLCTTEDIGRAIFETEPEVVIVDHLQRIQYTGENPAMGYKNVALKLKNYAVMSGVPIVLLSQVTFGEGWAEQLGDGSIVYHTDRMTTRWSKEPVMEADKVLVLHNLGLHNPSNNGQANLIVHSMRDYASGGVLPLRINPAHQFLGDYDRYRHEYSGKVGDSAER